MKLPKSLRVNGPIDVSPEKTFHEAAHAVVSAAYGLATRSIEMRSAPSGIPGKVGPHNNSGPSLRVMSFAEQAGVNAAGYYAETELFGRSKNEAWEGAAKDRKECKQLAEDYIKVGKEPKGTNAWQVGLDDCARFFQDQTKRDAVKELAQTITNELQAGRSLTSATDIYTAIKRHTSIHECLGEWIDAEFPELNEDGAHIESGRSYFVEEKTKGPDG